ncbi:hypothetical protein EA472_11050 [Natrarchaeobius oligotrophus]|uniref:Uncharacterized protein n=1 Tax=Natrarchaeobius chitinivorans TaxID=1679083 RepID=A0A3N6MCI2_NATCH|nr:hypothetical protein EA472_11050 [Natrarchaeobius chitinivorans]
MRIAVTAAADERRSIRNADPLSGRPFPFRRLPTAADPRSRCPLRSGSKFGLDPSAFPRKNDPFPDRNIEFRARETVTTTRTERSPIFTYFA